MKAGEPWADSEPFICCSAEEAPEVDECYRLVDVAANDKNDIAWLLDILNNTANQYDLIRIQPRLSLS